MDAERRQRCTHDEIEAALLALDRAPVIVPAHAWPDALTGLDQPGLYSWWTDPPGAGDLSAGLGFEVAAGRIYVGQTGATAWPSGKVRARTLGNRINSNHLRGNIYGSTFRRTLAAALRHGLALQPIGMKRPAPGGEQALSAWIRQHLSVAVYPFTERDVLTDLEHCVLQTLDPPLNLEGMPGTELRRRLSALRSALRAMD